MLKKPATPSIKFRKTGIFIKYGDDEERRIGDPIYVLAIGQGIQDKLSYTVLQLQDRDKRRRKAVVRSSLLTARTTEFKEQLTDVYNQWERLNAIQHSCCSAAVKRSSVNRQRAKKQEGPP